MLLYFSTLKGESNYKRGYLAIYKKMNWFYKLNTYHNTIYRNGNHP